MTSTDSPPSPRARHLLLVGATGMLAKAGEAIVPGALHTTLVASTTESLERFRASVPEASLSLLALDWSESDAVRASLSQACKEHGVFDAVLLWVHRNGHDLKLILAQLLDSASGPCHVWDVLGSAHADPLQHLSDQTVVLRAHPRVAYRAIVLGFVREKGGKRWLTHGEISQGVLRGIAQTLSTSDHTPFIVGETSPTMR